MYMKRLSVLVVSVLVLNTVTWTANVTTQRNDNYRSSLNLSEQILNTSNVNQSSFGKLFTRAVKGQVYAQPLYLSGVNIQGKGVRNLVFVATQENNVYAFDADDAAQTAPHWEVNLGKPMPVTDIANIQDLKPVVGITSTPVIDTSSNTIYIVAKSKDGTVRQSLHALDVATGKPRAGSPVVIEGKVGNITFDTKMHLQRPALLLSNGVVYIAFGSHGDREPWHGWVMGYDSRSLRQVSILNTTPTGKQGAIWQSGTGPAADDSGNLYFITGNGTFNANTGGKDLGQSFIKTDRNLSVSDWFAPCNHGFLNSIDLDLGSTGTLLIPQLSLLIGGGKNGYLYVMNTSNMGHYQSSADCGASANKSSGGDKQIVQKIGVIPDATRYRGHLHGTPVYWNGSAGQFLYMWGEGDRLKQFKYEGGKFSSSPTITSSFSAQRGMPGGMLALSGSQSDAVLWASLPHCPGASECDAGDNPAPGILRAFDAKNVSKELWNSSQNSGRDGLDGLLAKFNTPTVANGKVYVATFSNKLVVYGLLNGNPPSPTLNTTVQLGEGWNLVSLPIQPANTGIGSVLSGIASKVEVVYAFNGSAYQGYLPGETGNDLTTMEAGRGYWVYMNSAGTLNLSGKAAAKSVNLTEGWNLAGFSSTASQSVESALSSINGKFEAVYGFDNAANNYRAYVPSEGGDLTRLEPGKGYWIYATSAGVWQLP
jgi:hypothetical protein